jgi:2,3-bisphosphoglycerate-independent phosphoglycerate mutase
MRKVILIILDGVGIRANADGNAVALAKKPTFDWMLNNFPHTLLLASEQAVGLPKGQMGNSEVGHLNIGAGRIVYTGLSLINRAIELGFDKVDAFMQAINKAKQNKSTLHIMGLCSFGGVHSNLEHILALVKLAHDMQVRCVLHCFGDGRDVPPQTLLTDMQQTILPTIKKYNCKIGMISGRYYAMDRDQRWDRVQLAYSTLIGQNKNTFADPVAYIQAQYNKKITDEFIEPAMNNDDSVIIHDKDVVIFANFRPDRARELSHCLFNSTYYQYQPPKRVQLSYFVTMMKYEGIEPSAIAFGPTDLTNTLGQVISEHNLSQLRIAETEKYAHVTFFFDGGKEINYPKETKIIVPSPKVATYDLQPEMSANEVCDKLIANLATNDVIICNFANGDMVGHTGNLQATIQAIECLDRCLKKIYDAAKDQFTLFITADHGNADEEIDEHGNIVTAHTLSPVPFIICDKNINKIANNGKLSNIAPTILKYMGISIPKEMDEPPLI